MSGLRRALKSGAGAGGGSGSGMEGYEMSAGIRRLSCGFRREAVEVLGTRARADAKSCAVGFVRRARAMDVRA